jgi:hypothetical protein
MGGMRRGARLPVSSSEGFERGGWIQVDEGERAEMVQVLAVRPGLLKAGHIRWWHRALWWLQRMPGRAWRLLRAGWWLIREGLCGCRGHRIADGAACCWCTGRWAELDVSSDGTVTFRPPAA